MTFKKLNLVSAMSAALVLSACGNNPTSTEDINALPSFIAGSVGKTTYDGTTNDLLTGGLGKSGLQVAAPAFVDPANPTAAELRTRAIYNNYRALVDFSTAGGFGVLFGPNINAAGGTIANDGKVAGDESIAYSDDGSGKLNVTMMVHVPATFDVANPCIVTATSSGSRGVYGAIGTAGEWGNTRGCAVAFTDKGTGSGVHDLQGSKVTVQNGTISDATAAAKNSQFTANLTAAELAAFNAATPNRFAVKHAHSQQNPEKDWGTNTLQGIQFAFYVLNEKFGPLASDGVKHLRRFTAANTIVIASSVSNGGGAALAAAELDTDGLIDGVVVGEPQVQVTPNSSLSIKQGTTTFAATATSKGLLDFVTLANLYQPCASQAAALASSPSLASVNATRAANRCASLQAKGLLTATTLAGQADESLAMLRTNGWLPDSDLFQASHYAFAVPAVTYLYANAYGKSSVKDNLCGFSYSAIDAMGTPTALAAASLNGIFASGNGIPPNSGINIINNNSMGGPLLDGLSISPSTGLTDFNIDGAICARNLITGNSAAATAVQAGIAAVRRTGNLRGKPAIIVHGRSDTLEPVNHTSRPYFGINKIVEGSASKLNYYEVANAQHFDGFIPLFAGYQTRLVPLHFYLIKSLDLMLANLRTGAALPPSQVVRTVPRGDGAPAITAANVPPIQASPGANAITFSANTVTIPD